MPSMCPKSVSRYFSCVTVIVNGKLFTSYFLISCDLILLKAIKTCIHIRIYLILLHLTRSLS